MSGRADYEIQLLPTFSDLGGALACDGQAVLPRVGEETVYTGRGHHRHRFVADWFNLGRGAALDQAPAEAHDELARIDMEPLCRVFDSCHMPRAEVAFALDPVARSARELGQDIGRAYEAHGADRAREVCGTLDLYAISRSANEAVVVDMKGPHAAGDPAQLRAQALAVARRHGVDRVHVAFAHALDGGGWRFAALEVLDELALDGFEAQVAAAVPRWRRAAAARVPDVTEGPQCDWCASARYCPAKTAQIRAAGSLRLPDEVALLTNEERAGAWRLVRTYKPLLEGLERALRESARLDPIAGPDGWVVTTVPGNEEIDAAVGERVLRERYGEEAEAAVSRKLTKAGIKRALGDRADEALEAIRAAGGVTRGEDKVVEIQGGAPPARQLAAPLTGDLPGYRPDWAELVAAAPDLAEVDRLESDARAARLDLESAMRVSTALAARRRALIDEAAARAVDGAVESARAEFVARQIDDPRGEIGSFDRAPGGEVLDLFGRKDGGRS